MNKPKPGINMAVATERRRLLIDATMSAIAEHGLSQLTLAKIARVAGLSAGSMNFHFTSKEALLLETLNFLAGEFENNLDKALAAAGNDPAARLRAMFDASLDPEITDPRKMVVWYAFASETRSRADYQRICGAQDKKIFDITLHLCDQLIRQGDKQDYMNARAMANAVQGLIDEIWHEILYTGEDYDRSDAKFIYLSFLASVFPWAFDPMDHSHERAAPLSISDKSLHIVRVDAEQLTDAARLFDQYRQFYEQAPNPRLARKFMGDNIQKERSVAFLARDAQNRALGLVQLYPGWCSVTAAPYWILYDLYVEESARRRGVGKALMREAENMARKTRASRIDLETATDNHSAQTLYEELGYSRDTHFYKYSLELKY